MKKFVLIVIVLMMIGGCSSTITSTPETCEIKDHKQVFDTMGFVVGKLKEQIHTLGTETSPDYLTIKSETYDLLETTKRIQAPSCLEKSKGLLISTIDSMMVGIDFFLAGESEEAIKHINENTNEILNQYIQELIVVMSIEEGK